MTAPELATLGLLDPDQGVCPDGHTCSLSGRIGRRECRASEYAGLALVCWNVTDSAIEVAERDGADPTVVGWARLFLGDQGA